jgi:hypothetical protein
MLTVAMTQLRLKIQNIYSIILYFIMGVLFKESFTVLLNEIIKRKHEKLPRKTNDARILFYWKFMWNNSEKNIHYRVH